MLVDFGKAVGQATPLPRSLSISLWLLLASHEPWHACLLPFPYSEFSEMPGSPPAATASDTSSVDTSMRLRCASPQALDLQAILR